MMKRTCRLLALILAVLVLAPCVSPYFMAYVALAEEITGEAAVQETTPATTSASTPTDTPASADTSDPTDTPTPTDTSEPTDTPAPADTSEPTETPPSTDTSVPTDASTPTNTALPADTPEPSLDPAAEASLQALLTPPVIELPLGGSTGELLLHARDGVQHATLALPSSGYLTVTMTAAGEMTLYQHNAVVLRGSSLHGWLSAGSYDIEIRGDGSDATIQYSVTTAWQDAGRGNDVPERAAALACNGRFDEGAFTQTAKQNWWSITVPNDGYLLLESHADIQPLRLSLAHPNGECLLMIDTVLKDDPQTEIDGVWLHAGTYMLAVTADDVGTYSLRATFTATALESVRKSALRNAELPVHGGDISAALTPASPQHAYQINLAQAEKVRFVVYAYMSALRVYLYDGSGRTLLADASAKKTSGGTSSPYAHIIEQSLPAGQYTLEVGAMANGPYGVYQATSSTQFTLQALRLSSTLLQEGDSVSVSAVVSGGAATFYQYQLWQQNDQGEFTKISEQAGTANTSFTPGPGTYKIMGVVSDGANWAALYSDLFIVKGLKPLSITSITLDSSKANVGDPVTLYATFDGARPATQTVFQVFDSGNQLVGNLVTADGSVVYRPTQAGEFRVMVVGTDGVNWVSKWGPRFTVNAANPLSILSVSCHRQDVAVGAVIPFVCRYGGSVKPTLWVYEIYKDGQKVQSLQPNTDFGTFTPTAAGEYRIMAVCSDGTQWASRFSDTIRVSASPASLTVTAVTPDKATAAIGENVLFTLDAAGGSTLVMTEFQLYRGGVLIQKISGRDETCAFTLDTAGTYNVMAVVTDGAAWAAKFSPNITVSGDMEPFALGEISVDQTSIVAGGNVAFTASCLNGQPTQLTFQLYQDGQTLISSQTTDRSTWVCRIPAAGRYVVMVVATDGTHWVSKWGPAVTATSDGTLSISSISLSAQPATFGSSVRFQPHFVGGKRVIQTNYEVYNAATNQQLASFAGNSAYFDYTPTDYAVTVYRVMAVATDGDTWTSKWSDTVTFHAPAPLTIETVANDMTGLSVKVDTPVTFTATIREGLPLRETTHELYYRANETVTEWQKIDSFSGCTPVHTFTPISAGQYRVMFVAYDGITWVSKFSDPITVSGPRIYRALLVGQAYTGTSSALSGTVNDAAHMQKLLGQGRLQNRYSTTRRTDLTAGGILSAISSTFAGATEDDVSLFFYSGHGSDGGMLVGTDFFGIMPYQLRQTLDGIPGTKIVIVDACHSGGIIGKDANGNTPQNTNDDFSSAFLSAFAGASRSSSDLADSPYYVMVAAHSSEYSSESNIYDTQGYVRMGYFTYALTRVCGWNGISSSICSPSADTNGDGMLTMAEIYRAVNSLVSNYTSRQHAQVYPSASDYVVLQY